MRRERYKAGIRTAPIMPRGCAHCFNIYLFYSSLSGSCQIFFSGPVVIFKNKIDSNILKYFFGGARFVLFPGRPRQSPGGHVRARWLPGGGAEGEVAVPGGGAGRGEGQRPAGGGGGRGRPGRCCSPPLSGPGRRAGAGGGREGRRFPGGQRLGVARTGAPWGRGGGQAHSGWGRGEAPQ